MFRKTLLVGALLAPFIASAEGISYNFAELNYVTSDTNVDKADGFNLNGSFGINEMFYATGSYSSLSYDKANADSSPLSLGFGAHTNQWTGSFDLLGVLSYEDADTAVGTKKAEGFGLLVGARGEVSPGFEINGGLKYKDLDVLDGLDYGIGGVYAFNPSWAVTANYTKQDLEGKNNIKAESDDLRAGVRYIF